MAIAAPVVDEEGASIGWLPQSFMPVRPCKYRAATPAVCADAREVPPLEFVAVSLLFLAVGVPLVAEGMSKPGDHKANLLP